MDFTNDYTLTIDGAAVDTAARVDVINPATGKVFASAPCAGQAELDLAVAAATRALPAWKALGWEGRRDLLVKAAKAIEPKLDQFTALFVAEQGRPTALVKGEVQMGAWWLKSVARQDLPNEIVEDSDTRQVIVKHEPLGVVAAIVPWNFPFLLAMWKIAPALLAGNTMVLKPSPYTPLCSLKLAELWRDILPAGVYNVISGDDALGPLMTAHPGFAKISFTGSTATGKRVMEAASRDLKRITLELGGNDAAIVLPDVDVAEVAPKLFFGSFYNSAQVCIATKRLYIHDDIYDEMLGAFHRLAKEAVVGDGAQQGVQYGPVQNRAQYDRVRGLIDDARAEGLTLLQGADVPESDGYFIPITLVDNPPENAAVVTEEAFGPILPLLRFSDIDDVVARANNCDYGLAGAVWSKDIDAAVAVADRMETGTVWINDNFQNGPHIPFAGAKQSGFGVENGAEGLREFTFPKVIFVPKKPA
ncbi:aldehyde dehydrogenase family protein [Sphingopyxis sp. OPL5]|uniref:aldehyde dehydrogenase family protein n=1 Tax=Sphingopyxis sp. OPL5 TaxID=2486273 RepID=UPI00164D5FFB|nr:aldehyde dehydrogenase family protein [Sphingopyxis sp. OPL5]QNO28389.1 aldehyde dehydrogenase family protein [Sphingopyxis sp. OPL5]